MLNSWLVDISAKQHVTQGPVPVQIGVWRRSTYGVSASTENVISSVMRFRRAMAKLTAMILANNSKKD